MPVNLDQWAIYADMTQAPEVRRIALGGVVTGHPTKPDGTHVQTSPIVRSRGRLCTTQTGTVYRLGEPCPSYREWLDIYRPDWDPEHPVRIYHKHLQLVYEA